MTDITEREIARCFLAHTWSVIDDQARRIEIRDSFDAGARAVLRLIADHEATVPSPPAYEYATTTGPRKSWTDEMRPPDDRPGWEVDVSEGRNGWERFDYHEERYWRRIITPTAGADHV